MGKWFRATYRTKYYSCQKICGEVDASLSWKSRGCFQPGGFKKISRNCFVGTVSGAKAQDFVA